MRFSFPRHRNDIPWATLLIVCLLPAVFSLVAPVVDAETGVTTGSRGSAAASISVELGGHQQSHSKTTATVLARGEDTEVKVEIPVPGSTTVALAPGSWELTLDAPGHWAAPAHLQLAD
jgi:hypothetical protein